MFCLTAVMINYFYRLFWLIICNLDKKKLIFREILDIYFTFFFHKIFIQVFVNQFSIKVTSLNTLLVHNIMTCLRQTVSNSDLFFWLVFNYWCCIILPYKFRPGSIVAHILYCGGKLYLILLFIFWKRMRFKCVDKL